MYFNLRGTDKMKVEIYQDKLEKDHWIRFYEDLTICLKESEYQELKKAMNEYDQTREKQQK